MKKKQFINKYLKGREELFSVEYLFKGVDLELDDILLNLFGTIGLGRNIETIDSYSQYKQYHNFKYIKKENKIQTKNKINPLHFKCFTHDGQLIVHGATKEIFKMEVVIPIGEQQKFEKLEFEDFELQNRLSKNDVIVYQYKLKQSVDLLTLIENCSPVTTYRYFLRIKKL